MGLKMNHILKSIVGFFPRTVQFGGKWTATNKIFYFYISGRSAGEASSLGGRSLEAGRPRGPQRIDPG
jgi:hypothetical protein